MTAQPFVNLVLTASFKNGSFVAPNTWHNMQAQLPDGQVIGSVNFGVSPLNDRIYVDGLAVHPEFRKCGYATSMLATLVKQHSPADRLLPLTPLHEVSASSGFWSKLRRGSVPGLVVTQDVRVSEMAAESARWKLL